MLKVSNSPRRGSWVFTLLLLVPLSVIAMESLEGGAEEIHVPWFLPGTLLFASILAISHIASPWIERKLAGHQRFVTSFSGGMAIAYVFAHLLPELDAANRLFGAKIFLIALAGFAVYYGLERFAEREAGRARAKGRQPPTFRLQLGFLFVYNWLIVYGAPQERLETGLGVIPITIALWFHLAEGDYGLCRDYGKPFKAWGRYVLAIAPLLGWLSAVFLRSHDEAVNDIFVALLAGSVLYNVFQDELPKGEESKYGAFLAGVAGFVMFVILSRSM